MVISFQNCRRVVPLLGGILEREGTVIRKIGRVGWGVDQI